MTARQITLLRHVLDAMKNFDDLLVLCVSEKSRDLKIEKVRKLAEENQIVFQEIVGIEKSEKRTFLIDGFSHIAFLSIGK